MKFYRAIWLMTGALLFCITSMAQADSNQSGKYSMPPVNNQQYQDECGACHFAYQPGFLPSSSWRKVMENLADHFGENAELSDAVRQSLTSYLEKNAADKSSAYLSGKVMRSLPRNGTVLKISKIGFMVREHEDIPRRVFTKDFPGISNCKACHQRANEGSYRENEIKIPGYGRWDD